MEAAVVGIPVGAVTGLEKLRVVGRRCRSEGACHAACTAHAAVSDKKIFPFSVNR